MVAKRPYEIQTLILHSIDGIQGTNPHGLATMLGMQSILS